MPPALLSVPLLISLDLTLTNDAQNIGFDNAKTVFELLETPMNPKNCNDRELFAEITNLKAFRMSSLRLMVVERPGIPHTKRKTGLNMA